MSSFKRDKKEEEVGGGNPFQSLDKTTVLQETRYFNETPINHRKCAHILTKILYLLNQGENLTTQEATDAFFAITKLFQSKDMILRRMVYLCIKELSSNAQDIIIVTSSLTKDMTGKEDLYRSAAIRALYCVTDVTMLQSIERYMKQAIVDKNPAVSSAALVSTLHFASTSMDLVRRWANECQEAVSSDTIMVSYHALGVASAIKKNDKLATAKLVNKYAKSSLKSPYALCHLIRLAAKMVENDENDSASYEFIENCLRHKSEMVIYEAAYAIITLKNTARDLAPAVSVLQLFCGSTKPSLRLAGCRTLARLINKNPTAVSACAIDLENLISDENRSVATLAVTTLLATGAESSIDRLMKQIATFVSEISDEFKIVVVRAIRRLCSKFPRKHQSLVGFLSGMLRNEGGLEYKTAIADAIIGVVEENPDAKETGLAHLCEFIEDCEHSSLAVRILHLLGREGPKSRHPSRYIRFIYNRVILESGPVRAAAVSAVAQFGAQRPELFPNIRVLLSRCQMDDDDEVRDRAIYYLAILDTEDRQLISDFIINVPQPNFVLLEKALRDHIATRPDEKFDLASVPTVEKPRENLDKVVEIEHRKPAPIVSREEKYTDQLAQVPGIEKLGPVFKTNEPIELTEPETEYRVRCIKHVYSRHLILQFECTNTLTDIIIENAQIALDHTPEFKLIDATVCSKLAYDTPGNIFCVFELPENTSLTLTTMLATMQYSVRDCDPTTGETDPESYSDTYPLGEIEFGCPDQLRSKSYTEDEWESNWNCASTACEACDTFVLSQRDVEEAAVAVCAHFGFSRSAITGDAVKLVRGGGFWRGGVPVIVRARLALTDDGITMELATRSPKMEIAQLLLTAVG